MTISRRRKTERIREIVALIQDVADVSGKNERAISKALVKAEYRKERHGAWFSDESYASTRHARWICSECEHWQSVPKHVSEQQVCFMNYCPFCGAKMDKTLQECL